MPLECTLYILAEAVLNVGLRFMKITTARKSGKIVLTYLKAFFVRRVHVYEFSSDTFTLNMFMNFRADVKVCT